MIRHMRHGSPPRLMALQSILSPNRRESLPTPSAGVRITCPKCGAPFQATPLTRAPAPVAARARDAEEPETEAAGPEVVSLEDVEADEAACARSGSAVWLPPRRQRARGSRCGPARLDPGMPFAPPRLAVWLMCAPYSTLYSRPGCTLWRSARKPATSCLPPRTGPLGDCRSHCCQV